MPDQSRQGPPPLRRSAEAGRLDPSTGRDRSPTGELDLRGVVEGVTYRHPETLYTVLRVALEPESEAPGALFGGRAAGPAVVHAVGRAMDVPVGGRVALRGSWHSHPKHGPQFRFRTLAELPPVGPEGVARYLASRGFRGVGPVLAQRIVETLGTGALERIDADPECLRLVRGLRRGARQALVEGLRAQRGERELHAFLHGLELNAGQVLEAARTLAALGPEAAARVRANPYVLARTVKGVGFASADRAAQKLGLAEDSPERRAAALAFALERATDEGHTCVPEEALRAATTALLGLDVAPETFAADLAGLAAAGEVVPVADLRPDVTLVYPPALARSEGDLAANLAALLRSGPARAIADERALAAAERAASLALHPDQRAAVLGCLAAPVALLTGGPGVGKTTIVRLVAELAERAGVSVALASPTGRAAKRLSEATGRPASTVHRLLGWDPKAHRFQHDARTPLAAGLVIVDEISMLDVVLAHHLLKAVQPPARLVLVGDPDQLPSVSAGNVLADLIRSRAVPVFRLTRVFRQDAASRIVANAHRILAGELPEPAGRDDAGGDFYFFPAETDELAAQRAVEVVTERIPRRFGLEWTEDVQVLAPMYRGACGVDALNARLRAVLGGGGLEIAWGERTWRAGDRVIQTRNDYDKQVFNGDMGRVVRVDPERPGVVVRFPERELAYAGGELADLACAFAITVHRSQGGEFPAVVIPLVPQHWMMLQRNLLYTAITRARQLVVLVGSSRALDMALENDEQARRESGLEERLRRLAEGA